MGESHEACSRNSFAQDALIITLSLITIFQSTPATDDDVVFVKPKPIDDKTKAVLATAYKLPPNPCILVSILVFSLSLYRGFWSHIHWKSFLRQPVLRQNY